MPEALSNKKTKKNFNGIIKKRMKKSIIPGVILASFFLMFLIPFVYADVGPHTAVSLKFYVTYNNNSIAGNFRADLLACSEGSCAEIDNSDECSQGVCSFAYYRIERIPSQMKLLIDTNGESFSSDAINFSSENSPLFYDVNIMPDDKVIITPSPKQEETHDYSLYSLFMAWLPFIGALLLTIAIEMIVSIIFLKRWKIKSVKWRKPLLTVAISDIISVPLVWIIFLFLVAVLAAFLESWSVLIAIIITEAFAVVFEAYALFLFNKKILPLKRAFLLSIIMNIASFVIGDIILAAMLGMI
jgi:hypothetical protein